MADSLVEGDLANSFSGRATSMLAG